MLLMPGAASLVGKSEGEISMRARQIGARAALALVVLFRVAGLCVALGVDGYRIKSEINPSGPSNPLGKDVVLGAGGWLTTRAFQ
jgi:cytochrome d ubiquinol oxidase subunit II